MNESDIFETVIKYAALSKSEDAKPHPKVGVVAVRDGQIIAHGYRGKTGTGHHAEYGMLESDELRHENLGDITVYTTLEPCTTRNHPKVPCARRLVMGRVKRVVIGMIDPDVRICGRGLRSLFGAGIEIALFPDKYMKAIEDLNASFVQSKEPWREMYQYVNSPTIAAIEKPLDGWYLTIQQVYKYKNYHRSPESILAHLLEVIGGLSLLATGKDEGKIDYETIVPKCLAWWLALCDKHNVKSVERLVWSKFPGVCPYCEMETHKAAVCDQLRRSEELPNWVQLENRANRRDQIPASLAAWQRHFAKIYPPADQKSIRHTFARLAEELSELSEAVRVFPLNRSYFASEAADVFAWLMQVQNVLESNAGTDPSDWGLKLESSFAHAYPDCCVSCGTNPCTCAAVLPATIGRIAREGNSASGIFSD